MKVERAYYSEELGKFLKNSDEVLSTLTDKHRFDLSYKEKEAWKETVNILNSQLDGLDGHIMLEYSIPRMGRRIDVVLLCSGIVFVIEFKVGSCEYLGADLDQVIDYSLDLKNFHKASHKAHIVPILVSTKARHHNNRILWSHDNVSESQKSNGNDLGKIIKGIIKSKKVTPIDVEEWKRAGYCPTPTIIEAARVMYAENSVENISNNEAGRINLSKTTFAVDNIIRQSREKKRKSICFITGVPGAGKTLAGMDIVHGVHKTTKDGRAVFLSGNGPLVEILREALIRDSVERKKRKNIDNPNPPRITKKQEGEGVKKFIQNVHAFRKDHLIDIKTAPYEKVIVFDEAQRAWNQAELKRFMKKRHDWDNFDKSESELLMDVMGRHDDWTTIVCLVGGGQEIHRGEGGLSGWISALEKHPDWDVYLSKTDDDENYMWGNTNIGSLSNKVIYMEELHLSVSIRSFRSRYVDAFVNSLLKCDAEDAKKMLQNINNYPIVMTRSFDRAKKWIKRQARGTERYGVVASAKSYRLQPHGIYVELTTNPVKWFLNGKDDPKSSYSLEYAATEFEVQGLEVDWACVAWDADLRYNSEKWSHREFRGKKWNNVKAEDRQRYLRNAYRVLLTRARQGMAIFIPEGDDIDQTRNPKWYDPTYEYLKSLGIKEL